MADGAPISQEIKLPTDSTEIGKATAKLDELIKRVERAEKAAGQHGKASEASYKAVGQHATQASGLLSRMTRAVVLHAEGFRNVGLAAHEAHAKVGEFLEFVGAEAALEVLKGIAEKVIDIGKEALTAAAAAQRMNRVIDSASGGERAGAQNRGWLAEFSKKTEFSEGQSEGAFVDLKRVGTTDQQTKLAMKAAADIAAVSKNKDEAFATTIEAFARLQRTDKISNRTLAPLGLGEKDFAALPQFKGMNKKQISAQVEKGSVSRNDLYALIMARAGEKAIGEKAAANADLLGTKLSKLSELPERFYKKLADTKAIGVLSGALDGILNKLDPESPTGKKIGGFIEETFGKAASFLDGIDVPAKIDLMTDAFRGFLDIAGPIFRFAAHELEGIAYLVGRITGHIRSAADQNKNNIAEVHLKTEVDTYRTMQKYGGGTTEGDLAHKVRLGDISKEFSDAGAFDEAADRMRAAGKGAADGLAGGMEASEPKVAAAGGDMAEAAPRAAKHKLKQHSPSRVFEEIGMQTAEGFAVGLEGGAGRVGDAMDSTINIPSRGMGASAGERGRGSVSVTVAEGAFQISVTGHGDKREMASAVREELQRSLTPMFIDALENGQDEAGA